MRLVGLGRGAIVVKRMLQTEDVEVRSGSLSQGALGQRVSQGSLVALDAWPLRLAVYGPEQSGAS